MSTLSNLLALKYPNTVSTLDEVQEIIDTILPLFKLAFYCRTKTGHYRNLFAENERLKCMADILHRIRAITGRKIYATKI